MVLTLNNTNTLTADNIVVGGTNLSDIYATITYVNTNSGGVSQTDFDNSVSALQSKDIAYNNTLTSHISLIDTNTTDIINNASDIAILNTKQQQNFFNISSVTHLLNTDYQTTTQLNSNFVTPSSLTTTLGNYYTSTIADSLFYNQTYVNNNIYTKTEVDVLIAGAGGGGGYTDTQIDSFLSLKEDKSTFTDNVSFFPVIDLSRPSIIHQGLTLKNSVVNVEPLEGVLFSNQFGAETDRNVAVFRNQTNYITLQGNKINANATSDDSVVDLNLNPSGNINMNNDLSVNNVNITTNLAIGGEIDLTSNLTVNGDIQLTNANTSIERYTNLTKSNTSMDLSINETTSAIRLVNGINDDTDTNTYMECNNTTGGTTFFKPTYFKDSIYYETDNFNISNNSGLTIYKPTTDASNVVAIANNSGKIRFRGFSIDAYNTNDSSQQLFLNMNNSNAVRCNKLGIGANAVVDVLNVNGGNSNFSSTVRFNGATTFNNEILIWNNSKIYRRADANNSLNLITNDEINFSFQANRATDPTTATIALQLTDTNGITLNRAVTNNLTFNSIGRMTAESDLDVWGELFFQHSSSIKETLNGSDYDLDIRNGDTDRAINFIIGTIGSTPEIQLTEGKVTLLGNLEITHTDVAGSQRVLINNPDTDGFIRLSNNNLSRLDATNNGVDIYGDLSYTGSLIPSSDKRLKKDIKELNSKKAVELVKYIKPKTYHFIDDRLQGKSCCGFIANDFMEYKKMPDEWQNLVKEGKDGYLKFDYTITTPILWSALQNALNRIDKLEKEVNKLKGKGKGKSDSD